MVRTLLRTNSIVSFLILGLFSLCIWIPFMSMEARIDIESLAWPMNLLSDLIVHWPMLYKILNLAVILLTGLVIQSAINGSDIRASMTLEPIFWFVGISATFLLSPFPLPALIANFFLALSFRRLMSLGQQKGMLSVAFDSGLFIALASLFSFYYFMSLLVAWIAIGSTKSLSWRELVWSLLGFSLPLYLVFSYQYLTDTYVDIPFWSANAHVESLEPLNLVQILLLAFTISLFLWSLKNTFSGINTQNISKRKLTWISSSLLTVCFLIVLLNSFAGSVSAAFCMLSVPMTLFFINMFPSEKKALVPDILTALWALATIGMAFTSVVQN